MNLFKLTYALALVSVGRFWFYHLCPISQIEFLSTFYADKAEAQKSSSYAMLLLSRLSCMAPMKLEMNFKIPHNTQFKYR